MVKNFVASLDSNSWSYAALTLVPVVSDVVFHLKYDLLASDIASRVQVMQSQKRALTEPKLRELLSQVNELHKAPQRMKVIAGIHWISGAPLWLVSPVAATISILYGGIHGFLAARKEEQNGVEQHWKAISEHCRNQPHFGRLVKELVPELYSHSYSF